MAIRGRNKQIGQSIVIGAYRVRVYEITFTNDPTGYFARVNALNEEVSWIVKDADNQFFVHPDLALVCGVMYAAGDSGLSPVFIFPIDNQFFSVSRFR